MSRSAKNITEGRGSASCKGNPGPSKSPAISVNIGVALYYWQTANGVSAGELDSNLQQDRQEVSGSKLLFTEMSVI